MDLTNLENALNNKDFKEQVYRSLEGIYQISKVLNQLDFLKNISEYDLETRLNTQLQGIVSSEIQKLNDAGNEVRTQLTQAKNDLKKELEAKINDLVEKLVEVKKQDLETRLNTQLQGIVSSEIQQKLNDAGNEVGTQLTQAKNDLKKELEAKINDLVEKLVEVKKKELETRLNTQLQGIVSSEIQKFNDSGKALRTQLINKLNEAKNNLVQTLKQPQGVTKFLGIYVYGEETFFKNESDIFIELFELRDATLQANKSYLVQFSMPYELLTDGLYSSSMGEMILCLKTNSKVWPIVNSFYQNKTAGLINHKITGSYRTNSVFKTPSEQADYKIAVFARKHKNLWVNVNYTNNTQGFETSFLNNAEFKGFTTQSIPTTYNNDRVFYKHSQAIIYEIFQ
ncbi:apolipoprotein A1/A4/E family protein [Helicobacter pylori]|nr:apolipoprotein A1/A4/E family protein [Helicobacter pylori]